PPPSPPFPYTTLFRSNVSRGVARRRQDARVIANSKVMADDLGSFCLNHRQHAVAERCDFRLRVLLGPVVKLTFGKHIARLREGRDRKSTRLNSSHRTI